MRFRLLTAVTAASVWVLVAVGGVVRVTESGLGCPHWPLCTDRAVPLDQRASVIEYSHRAVVAWVTLLVVAVAVAAWRTQRHRRDVLVPALFAAGLVPFQALLGATAVWLTLPGWVVAFHFLVGLLFLAATVITAVSAWRSPKPSSTAGFTLLTRVGVLVGLALVSVGAAVVATDSDTACGASWPACNGGFASGGGHAGLQVAHRMLAYTLAAIAITLLALAQRRHGPRWVGTIPAIAVLVQISLGVGIVLTGDDDRAHEFFAGAHEAGAGVVWALLIALATLSRAAPSRETAQPASFADLADVVG